MNGTVSVDDIDKKIPISKNVYEIFSGCKGLFSGIASCYIIQVCYTKDNIAGS